MFYKVSLFDLNMHKDPKLGSPIVGAILKGEVGRAIEGPQDGFVMLQAPPNPPRIPGWVKLENNGDKLLEEVEAPQQEETQEEIQMDAFIKACILAERRFNDSEVNDTGFFIIADYLIAWADIESGIRNIDGEDPLDDRTGPFQFSSADWLRFLDSRSGEGFNVGDREIPLLQIDGAASLALDAMSAISTGVGSSDRYVPSYVDVLLANLLGNKAAVAIRKAKVANNGASAVDAVLQPVFSVDELAKLKKFRGTLVKNRSIDNAKVGETVDFLNSAKTVDDLLSTTENLLDSELQTAFALFEKNDPDDLPKLDGAAPWMDVAKAQLEDWTQSLGDNESTPGGVGRIKEYFKAIGNDKATGRDPWCAAFVGYCLTEGNPSFAMTVPKEAAWAPNWANWGNMSVPPGQQEIPKGAIVTLSPDKETNKIGHVGFCNSSNSTQVEILGGNQHNTVNFTSFPRSRIVAIRWLSQEGSDTASADVTAPGQFTKLLDFIAQPESARNPNAFFGNTRNQSNPKFTAMTLAEVVNWQRNFVKAGHESSAVGKYQFMPDTLTMLIKLGVATSQDKLDEPTQDKLAVALMNGRGLRQFLAKKLSAEDFGVNLAMEWASMPVPKDVVRQTKNGAVHVHVGQSYYAGVGSNQSLVPVDKFMDAIRSVLS